MDKVHQLFVLLLIHDDNDLSARGIVIRTDDLIEGRAAVKIMQHKGHDLIQLGRNDAHLPLDVQTENELVHENTGEIGTQECQHHGL